MSECERHRPKLEAYLAGDITEGEALEALNHARPCADCAALLTLHRRLNALGDSAPLPDAAAFDRMQASALRRVARRQRGARAWVFSPFLRGAAAMAAAMLLFLAGWLVAAPRKAKHADDLSRSLVNAIGAAAAANHAIEDVEASRFIWSNVSMRRVGSGDVALDFDLTTHVQVVEPIDSPVFQEALAQSLLNPASTGSRLNALRFAEGAVAPKVRDALVFALRHDESLAVRLEALTLLAQHSEQPEVEAAILETLKDDESVQMRLLALDCLAKKPIDRGRIRSVIREGGRSGDEALLVRLAQLDKGI